MDLQSIITNLSKIDQTELIKIVTSAKSQLDWFQNMENMVSASPNRRDLIKIIKHQQNLFERESDDNKVWREISLFWNGRSQSNEPSHIDSEIPITEPGIYKEEIDGIIKYQFASIVLKGRCFYMMLFNNDSIKLQFIQVHHFYDDENGNIIAFNCDPIATGCKVDRFIIKSFDSKVWEKSVETIGMITDGKTVKNPEDIITNQSNRISELEKLVKDQEKDLEKDEEIKFKLIQDRLDFQNKLISCQKSIKSKIQKVKDDAHLEKTKLESDKNQKIAQLERQNLELQQLLARQTDRGNLYKEKIDQAWELFSSNQKIQFKRKFNRISKRSSVYGALKQDLPAKKRFKADHVNL